MARPVKEGLTYFSHDTDAVNDEKVEALRTFYGNDGYAFYFILLERIYRTNNAELDISDADTCKILASKLLVTDQKFAEMLQTSIKWGLFNKEQYNNNHILTSNGIKKRAGVVVDKRLEMRNRYAKTKLSDNTLRVSAVETPPENTQKVHQVKYSKVKNSSSNIQTLQEYIGELTKEFNELDVLEEIRKCDIWWSEGKRKMSRPKTAYRNWLLKAREYKKEHSDKLPVSKYKYITGESINGK